MGFPISRQRWIQVPVLGGLVLLLLLSVAGAQEPPAEDDAAAEVPRQRLAERDRLAGQAQQFQQAGELAEAIQAMEGVLVLEQEVFGAAHDECAGNLGWIASLEEALGDFAAARRRLEEVLRIRTETHETGHWRVADARRALGDLGRRERLSACQEISAPFPACNRYRPMWIARKPYE